MKLFKPVTPLWRFGRNNQQSALYVTGCNNSTELNFPDIALAVCLVFRHIAHPHVLLHWYGSLHSQETYYHTPSQTSAPFISSPQLSKVRQKVGWESERVWGERDTEETLSLSSLITAWCDTIQSQDFFEHNPPTHPQKQLNTKVPSTR